MDYFKEILIFTVVLWLCTGTVAEPEPIPDHIVFVELGADDAHIPCVGLAAHYNVYRWLLWKANGTGGHFDWMIKYSREENSGKYYDNYEGQGHKYMVDNEQDNTLLVKSIEMEDTGYFKCQDSGDKSFNVITRLQVVVPPQDGNVNIYRQQGETRGPYPEGQGDRLRCRVTDLFPGGQITSLSYYVERRLIASVKSPPISIDPDGKGSVELKVTPVFRRSDNGGEMVCRAEWTAGDYHSNATTIVQPISVTFEASELNMTVRPSGAVYEASTQEFTCETNEANPMAAIQWNQAGDVVLHSEPGNNNALRACSTITLTISRDMDGQTVECYVPGSTSLFRNYTLQVLSLPKYPLEVLIDEQMVLSWNVVLDAVFPQTVVVQHREQSDTVSYQFINSSILEVATRGQTLQYELKGLHFGKVYDIRLVVNDGSVETLMPAKTITIGNHSASKAIKSKSTAKQSDIAVVAGIPAGAIAVVMVMVVVVGVTVYRKKANASGAEDNRAEDPDGGYNRETMYQEINDDEVVDFPAAPEQVIDPRVDIVDVPCEYLHAPVAANNSSTSVSLEPVSPPGRNDVTSDYLEPMSPPSGNDDYLQPLCSCNSDNNDGSHKVASEQSGVAPEEQKVAFEEPVEYTKLRDSSIVGPAPTVYTDLI